jgi:membrane-associated phospholipid phosphatase
VNPRTRIGKDRFITHSPVEVQSCLRRTARQRCGIGQSALEGKLSRTPGGVSLNSASRIRAAQLFVIVTAVVGLPPVANSQMTTPPPVTEAPALRWWHGAIVLGGLSALMLLDEPTQRFVQDHRSSSGDDVARAFRHFGQPEVYGSVTLGLVASGLISGNSDITRAGGRLAAALLVAGGTSTVGKMVLGRPRPSVSQDADVYHLFSGHDDAMPSGHSTIAFALATSLADDLHSTWSTVELYTLATGVAWSRVNDNRHWLSDVAAGAIVGITSAKLVDGRWRLFHLHPPTVLLGPKHAGLAWQFAF